MTSEGYEPKTIRNLWGVISLIWQAALGQKYVDAVLPKPKLPKSVKKQDPKTRSAVRIIAVSPQLASLLWIEVAKQKTAGRSYLFTVPSGTPLDMDVYRQRKLKPSLEALELPLAGFHAFRHFNVSMLDSLRVPLKTIQERIGHALTGSFTLEVYGHALEWKSNEEAAQRMGDEIEKATQKAALQDEKPSDSGCLSTIQGERLGSVIS